MLLTRPAVLVNGVVVHRTDELEKLQGVEIVQQRREGVGGRVGTLVGRYSTCGCSSCRKMILSAWNLHADIVFTRSWQLLI